jgi:hypothetical protein
MTPPDKTPWDDLFARSAILPGVPTEELASTRHFLQVVSFLECLRFDVFASNTDTKSIVILPLTKTHRFQIVTVGEALLKARDTKTKL